MRELRLHSDTTTDGDRRPDTIPFPGATAGANRLPPRRASFDSIQMAERALENVERHVDELTGLGGQKRQKTQRGYKGKKHPPTDAR